MATIRRVMQISSQENGGRRVVAYCSQLLLFWRRCCCCCAVVVFDVVVVVVAVVVAVVVVVVVAVVEGWRWVVPFKGMSPPLFFLSLSLSLFLLTFLTPSLSHSVFFSSFRLPNFERIQLPIGYTTTTLLRTSVVLPNFFIDSRCFI